MVTMLSSGLRDIAAVIVRNEKIGNAARSIYALRNGLFGADVQCAEKTLTDAERFERARAQVAKEWNNN